jgi:hypothetical protein
VLLNTPTRSAVPCLVAAGATAKTTTIVDYADHHGILLAAFNAAGMPPEDFFGIPFLTPNGPMQVPPSSVVQTALREKKDCLIFVDECMSATEPVYAALMRVTDRNPYIGEYRMPANMRVCLAGNPLDVAISACRMPNVLRTRLSYAPWGHIDHESEFIPYQIAKTDGVPNPGSYDWKPRPNPDEWREARRSALQFYIGTTKQPHFVYEELRNATADQIAEIKSRETTGIADARTWDATIDILATCILYNDMDAFYLLTPGTVGPAQASVINNYIRNNDLPDVEAILNGTLDWRPAFNRVDQIHATSIGMALACKKRGKDAQARVNRFFDIHIRLLNDCPVLKHLIRESVSNVFRNMPGSAVLDAAHRKAIHDEFHDFAR